MSNIIIKLTEPQVWAIAIACAFMVMDILTGFIGAVINGNVSSAKMRIGLGHKILLCCLIAVAVMIELAGTHIAGLGFSGVSVTVVCVYIIIMEVASILENVCAAYPELRDTPLMRIFDHDVDGE